MKTYQFATFAVIGAILVGFLIYKGTKKKCSCQDHADAEILPATDKE